MVSVWTLWRRGRPPPVAWTRSRRHVTAVARLFLPGSDREKEFCHRAHNLSARAARQRASSVLHLGVQGSAFSLYLFFFFPSLRHARRRNDGDRVSRSRRSTLDARRRRRGDRSRR